ncbi:hypothetical protein L1275_003077 [Flavobacterium sp. HSC-61S13]|nr:hypothetical protein [Flavobacterium sp. HSC-61S13]
MSLLYLVKQSTLRYGILIIAKQLKRLDNDQKNYY